MTGLLAIPLAPTLAGVLLAILVTNLGRAIFVPPMIAWLGDLFPATQRSQANAAFSPTFKGSECLCRFLVLRTLHTTRSRDRAHHSPTGDQDGHQRAACPLAQLSIMGPRLLGQTRPTPLRPLGVRSGRCCLGAAGPGPGVLPRAATGPARLRRAGSRLAGAAPPHRRPASPRGPRRGRARPPARSPDRARS